MATINVLHGPNLNLLGSRESEVYGHRTLSYIDNALNSLASQLGHKLSSLQSNAEHVLIEHIQAAKCDFIIINPAAFTHTSIALRDTLLAKAIPFVEVHLSNTHRREAFRKHSYFSDIAIGTITGLGAQGYEYALRFAHDYLTK